MANRSEEKTKPVIEEIKKTAGNQAKVEFIALDLNDLDSVIQFVKKFISKY